MKWKGKKQNPEREKLKDRRGSRSSSEANRKDFDFLEAMAQLSERGAFAVAFFITFGRI